MTSQKRKAGVAKPSGESPPKRARSGSSGDKADKQNGDAHVSAEPSDQHVEPSNTPVKSSNGSQAAPDNKNGADFLRELPQSWDQADAADKLLVEMKENRTKAAWGEIERNWERKTGEKPPKGILSDRYRSLKDIRAHSKAGSPISGEAKSEAVQKPSKTSNDMPTLPTTGVRPPSPATDGPPDASSRAISKRLRATVELSASPRAAPASDISPEEDLPQSWEQANAGDQLIVRMKSGKNGGKNGWERIGEAWQILTGEKPAEGALKDRYDLIKTLVMYPGASGEKTSKSLVKASTSDGASNSTITKPSLRTLRKRCAEAEVLEQSLDESLDASLVQSSEDVSKHSKTTARRKPRSANEQQMRASATGGSSDAPISEDMELEAEGPSHGTGKAGSLDEPEGIPKHPTVVAKSANHPRGKPAGAANSGNQDTMETADEVLVEMRERGCTWVEISKAWTDRFGLTHLPASLQKRYSRITKGSATKTTPTTQASSKRKMKATSPDEDLYASSSKRRKSTAETSCDPELPVKRNVDRGKQKSSVKYTESTTDEDELYAAAVEPVVTAPAKRNAGRATKVNRSDPEWLVTNEKSPLAYEDLHAEFSSPKTYEYFTKSDWEEIRETLPPNIPLNPDGYSIPMTFFKYDPDFRRGIREFQEDLGSGRLDPKWQAAAAQAMEERAQGKFDAYKENQYEEFWGQKQKLNHDALAGESTKIKLELLIQNGTFKVGDYFSYARVFGRGKNGVQVEKECKIVEVDGKILTFAIPPGQRKYSRRMFESATLGDTEPEAITTTVVADTQPPIGVDIKPGAAQGPPGPETSGHEASKNSERGEGALIDEETAKNGNPPDSRKTEEANPALEEKVDENDMAEPVNPECQGAEATNKSPENENPGKTAADGSNANGTSSQTDGGHSSAPAVSEEDVLHSISMLTQLENKIVDVDGRFNSKDIATHNTWRSFRGMRNNQDLGTLFEMREEFYVYKHPQIVKEAKKGR